MECDTNHCFCCFCATQTLPIIQQPTTTLQIFYVGHVSEALCIFNRLVEHTMLLFMMGWCSYLLSPTTTAKNNCDENWLSRWALARSEICLLFFDRHSWLGIISSHTVIYFVVPKSGLRTRNVGHFLIYWTTGESHCRHPSSNELILLCC